MAVDFFWDEEEIYDLLDSCERDGLLPYIEQFVDKDELILESGCGLSRWVKKLGDMGYSCLGIEYSETTIKKVKKHWPELNICVGDVLNHPFRDNSFGVIISLGVVEHFEDGPSQALYDIKRLLKPGGIAIITVPCFNTIRKLKHPLTHNRITIYRSRLKFFNKKFYEYRFTPEYFLSIVKETGFEIIEQKPFSIIDGFYHELNPLHLFVKFQKWKFHPQDLWLNQFLSKIPFFHCHMQIIIVRKPIEFKLNCHILRGTFKSKK